MATDILVQNPGNEDPAAHAFEGVRRELKLLRHAVEGFTAERNDIDIPDYSATLEQLAESMEKHSGYFRGLAAKPALEQTVQSIADQIVIQAKTVRGDESAALNRASVMFSEASDSITARVKAARNRDQQNKWVWKIAGATAVGFAILGATVPGIIAYLAPSAWAWPERRAASSLGMGLSEAGMRMIRIDGSDEARAIIRAVHVISDNAETVTACYKAVATTSKPARCAISIRPEVSPPQK